MKILFDDQIFTLQKYGGISRYFAELIKGLNEIEKGIPDYFILYTHNQYILDYKMSFMPPLLENMDFKGKYKILASLYNIQASVVKNKLKKQQFDIFHPTYYNDYFLNFIDDKPFVLTIYDMIHEIYPDFFSKGDTTSIIKKKLAEKASKIIAISENTKTDILYFYPNIDKAKIEVIPLANSLSGKAQKPKIAIPDKYILFVGHRETYKNFLFLIEAVLPLLKENPTLFIVCSGGGKFTEKELGLFMKLGIKERLIHLSSNDDELIFLYKNAHVFVFPSLYEGFGIPVLEAFSCGCPVILSKSSSFIEVGGKAVVFFDPQDKEMLYNAVKGVLEDEQLRSDLIERGYSQLKNFTWQKMVEKTISLYQDIIDNHKF